MRKAAPPLHLRPDHREIVCDILRNRIPDRKVLVFGSRANQTARKYSDLDLAVLGNESLDFDVASALAEDFSESDLPFKVDVVDWMTTDEAFRDIIRRDGIAIQAPAGSLAEA